MCLGMPGQVVSIKGTTAVVDFWGARKEVRIDSVEEVIAAGDYLISHLGVAVRRVPASAVADTLLLYESVLPEAGGDQILQVILEEQNPKPPVEPA